MSAKTLMVMGTASDVGKSVIAAALCRAFARAGVRVAPFKAQNMSNNAAVCRGGGEIGRAQAVQAEACGLEPTVDMNPVLLKPESINGCQVVVRGRASFHLSANEQTGYREKVWPEIVRSYRTLAENYELVVIEGAGSAAEVNLRNRDLVNWAIAELADAPVILVGNIDKGGVFAALVGTIELLAPDERRRVAGMLINKFRGNRSMLDSGLEFLRERTGVPVLGVMPYERELGIPDEDAALLDDLQKPPRTAPVTIGVVRLPCISNFTDFEPFEHDDDVAVVYLSDPNAAPKVDLLILPGSKATVDDLRWFRRTGWENYLARHQREGGWIMGICGGYQMIGRRIIDPMHVESSVTETVGLGLLDLETAFESDKLTARVRAIDCRNGHEISGYEIHSGRITVAPPHHSLFTIIERDGIGVSEAEGARSPDGRILGTAIHGLFDSSAFRRSFIDSLRAEKGLAPIAAQPGADAVLMRAKSYDRLADLLEENCDFERIAEIAGLSAKVGRA